MSAVQSVQCFGKKKTATAVAHCKQGKGLIKVNGKPLSLVEPQILRFKVYEPVLILGLDKFGTSRHSRREGGATMESLDTMKEQLVALAKAKKMERTMGTAGAWAG
jgi:small subunit ribosomal protein S16e